MFTSRNPEPAVPYWRLSGVYFFVCAVLGTMLPYWMLFMESLGYSAWQTGQLTALQMVTTLIAPYVWGEVCDRASSRLRVIRAGNLAAALIFLCVFAFFEHYWALVLAVCASAFCWQGLNAQFEIITLNHLGKDPHRYGRIRLWGSFGFLSAVWLTGQIINLYSVALLPYIVAGLLFTLWLMTLVNRDQPVKEQPDGNQEQPGGIWQNPVLWLLLVVFFLVNFSHGSYYGYYSLFLKQEGISAAVTGNLWTVAVASELLMFAVMPWFMRRFSLRFILLVSLFLTAFRWLGTGMQAGNVAELTLLQLLHGVSFSAVHTVAVLLFKQCVHTAHEGKAQALYCAVCIGGGQAAGVAAGGQIWAISPVASFYFSAAVAAGAAVIAMLFLTANRLGPAGKEQQV